MVKNQRKATSFALIAIGFWSTVGTAFKLSLRYVDFLHLLLYSSFISLIVLAVIILSDKNRWTLLKCNKSDILHSALLGFLNPFLYYTILLKAYSILPAQEAIVLNYTWPVVLLLLSIPLLKQKVNTMSLIAILLSFAGTIVTVTHARFDGLNFENPVGTALAMGSAFIWASFWIFNARDKRDELNKLFFNFLFGFIYTLITISILKLSSPDQGKSLLDSIFPWPGVYGLAGILYIGLFEMGITFVLWMKAMQLTTATAKITNLIYISPFISLILVGLIVGENILPSTIAGLILIVTGILLQRPMKSAG
jgi:drug/metabolite transporter (DMT)-like permease